MPYLFTYWVFNGGIIIDDEASAPCEKAVSINGTCNITSR